MMNHKYTMTTQYTDLTDNITDLDTGESIPNDVKKEVISSSVGFILVTERSVFALVRLQVQVC